MEREHGPAHSREIAMKALAHVTERLDHAITLLADSDVEQVQRAYEVARECTEQLARSMWFLRRAARVDEDASAS